MIIDKDLIKEAKEKLGDKAAFIIAAELELKEFDEKNLKAICKWHEEDTPSLIWNPKEDSYKCFGCGKVYGIIDHYMAHDKLTFLGAAQKLFQKVDIKHAFGNIGIKQREYKYPRYLEDNNRILAEKYLATRGISPETLDYFDVKQYKGNVVFNFYDTNDVLTTVKLRPSRKLQKGEHPKMWFLPNYDNKPILYGMNKIDPTKPLLITEGECLTGSAEVLTPDGWIRLDEYDGEQVMQVDENMSGSFVTPLAYIKKKYSGNIHIGKTDRKSYYSEMTSSHNFVYYNERNTLTRRPISSLPNRISGGKIPTSITHNGEGIPLTNEEIALFIAVSADGSIKYRKNYDLYHCRFTVARDDKYLRMKYLLDELGIEYTDNPDIGKKTKDGKTSFKYLGFLLPKWMRGKEFPMEWVQQATLEQKLFILQELILWDGNKVKGRRYTEYWSISENNADFIQAIAATSGIMATKRMKYPTRGNHSALWGVKIIYGKEYVSIQRNFFEKEHYDGMVYCVTVPTGMFLMRQNDKISVTGNCDALSTYEAGYSNVVSIPGGTENKKWIDECWDWLEQFDKIILAYDNDDAGIKARKDVASRLGIWRTQYIIIDDKFVQQDGKTPCKDLNEVLINYGKDAVMSLIESAQDVPVEGVNNLSTVGVFDIEKAEGLYPRLKPLDDIVYKFLMGSVVVFTGKRGCVDADTEYFDGNGWKRIADYALGDKVLQFNKDETAELVMPLEYHKYPEGKMWHFKTKHGIDQVVSDEHEVVYWTSKDNLYKKSAKEIVDWYKDKDKGHKYRFSYNGSIPTVFEYSGDGLPYDDITLRLFVASVCDGSYYYNVSENADTYTKCRFHIKKEHKKERLRRLFAKSSYEHNEVESANNGYTDFYITLPLRVKEFEGWWYSANNAQLKLILEEALLWDGSIGKKSPSFSSSVKANIDFIQFAAHATGHTATIYTNDRRGTKKKDSEYTYKSLEYSATITNRRKLYLGYEKSLIKEYVPKDGYKYCFTVPSGMLVLRRNGRVFVTGNSGKSSFINQAFVNEGLNQGYDIFYYSGELDPRVLKSWLDVNLAGEEHIRSEQDGFVRIIDKTALQEINKWYNGRVWVYDNHSHKAADIINAAQATTRRYGTKVWIIDNLMMLDLESDGDMSSVLQKQKEFISNLVRLAQLYNVLVVLAIHPRKGMAGQNELTADDVSGSGDLTNMSQYVISVHRYTDREKEGEMNNRGEYKKGKEPIEHDVCIEVLKNRFTGKNGKADLYFNYADYRFYSNEDELYRRYKWNKSTEPVKKKKRENEASAFFIE